jgi:hypothetical protein
VKAQLQGVCETSKNFAMKCVIIALSVLLVSCDLAAQPFDNGGMGHFMAGPGWIFSAKIDDYLSRPEVLGPSYDPSHMGMMMGGEGFGISNRFLIGGGGYGIGVFTIASDSAEITEYQGGGYFKAGYIFWNMPATFATANVGIGFAGHSYEIYNRRSVNGIFFNQEFPIMKGQQRTYSYGSMMLDLSAGIKTVLDKPEGGKVGGVMFGLDAGLICDLAISDWYCYESGDENIYGAPKPGITTIPYFRLTIGGGGFKTGTHAGGGAETPEPQE